MPPTVERVSGDMLEGVIGDEQVMRLKYQVSDLYGHWRRASRRLRIATNHRRAWLQCISDYLKKQKKGGGMTPVATADLPDGDGVEATVEV
jgi:hypothetical protein